MRGRGLWPGSLNSSEGTIHRDCGVNDSLGLPFWVFRMPNPAGGGAPGHMEGSLLLWAADVSVSPTRRG